MTSVAWSLLVSLHTFAGRRIAHLGMSAVVVVSLLAQEMTSGSPPIAHSQTSPPGMQLIRRMEQMAISRGTFHERLQLTTVSSGAREIVTQDLDVDLRRHLLHQVGVDRLTKLSGAVVSQDMFERISVNYRSGTRNNGGAWSCQRFQPGHIQLVGRGTYLAGVGWPRRAVTLGPMIWRGVPVWHVRATILVGGATGGYKPPVRADLLIARSDSALLREAWHPGTAATETAIYSRYGAPVQISLPAACRDTYELYNKAPLVGVPMGRNRPGLRAPSTG